MAVARQMTLILVMGLPGVGKSTCARGVFNALDCAALLDMDNFITVEPWEYGPALFTLGLQNAGAIATNMFRVGYTQIVLSGGIGNQESIDEFRQYLPPIQSVHYFWLTATPETLSKRRVLRNRDGADTDLSFHDHLNSLAPDPCKLSGADYCRVDTTEIDQLTVTKHLINYLKGKGLTFRNADAST
jgi:predicted kinase